MVYIKNIQLTSAFDEKNPHQLFIDKMPIFDHLKIFESIVYVLIHKEKHKKTNSKVAKFASKTQRGILVGYDGRIIYPVYFKSNRDKNPAVIQVKNLQIHENVITKETTELVIYDANSISIEVVSDIPKKKNRPLK